MKQTIQTPHYLLPLLPFLFSALTFTGCSQLTSKKSDEKKMTTTTSVSKNDKNDYSGKDLIGANNDITGHASTNSLDDHGINTNDLNGHSHTNNAHNVDPNSQTAIDAEIQAAINALETESKALTPADINDPQSILAQRVIYFDYDQSTILEKYKPILAAHAELLANYPEVHIRLEGHADERGSREYNVALSERRAETVRQYLSFKNVASTQTETVAFGEEKPLVPSHNDNAWNKNRRVEINYLTY